MEQYIWQNKSWPHFFWNPQSLLYPLANLYKKQGFLEGQLQKLDTDKIKKLTLNCFASEIVNSYKLDNIDIDEENIKIIIAKKLGIENIILENKNIKQLHHKETEKLETIASVFLEIIETRNVPLTIEKLTKWNKQLSSISESESDKSDNTEDYNKTKEIYFRQEKYTYSEKDKIYYTAPSPASLPAEMETFIKWFNKEDSFQELDNILKSAITQFYIIAIHPFEKNNNILARMIAYRVLIHKNNYYTNETQQDLKEKTNFSTDYLYSVNEQIVKYQNDYKYMLIQMATGNMDMTVWLSWYIKNSILAITSAITSLPKKTATTSQPVCPTHQAGQPKTVPLEKRETVRKTAAGKAPLNKTNTVKEKSTSVKMSSDKKMEKPLNKRQQQALEYMKTNADKKFTTSEYSKMYECSQDTASRDLEKLIKSGFIEKGNGGGRSTYYSLRK